MSDSATPATTSQGINTPTQVVRQPRGGIAINGKRMDDALLDASVTNNAYFSADTFRATVLISKVEFDATYWADTDKLEVEIFVGFGVDEPPSTSLIIGRVDELDMDVVERKVTLSGRDFTADLIEAKTTEKWPNKTASQIVQEIAGRHGLTAVVTPTTTLAGKYYQLEHARLTDDTTEWNLLTYLAEQEGMDVYTKGRELHFEKPPDPASAPRWTLVYTPSSESTRFPVAAATKLTMRKSLTIARDLTVKVVTWNPKQKRALTVSRSSTQRVGRIAQGQRGTRTPYVYRLPGLTEEQAIREAERRLADLTRHARILGATLPGHPDIDTRTILTLRGTGTSFDTDYRLDEIERSISHTGGFTMNVTARSGPPPDSRAAL